MRIGVAKEIKPQEYRVALTPAGARELVQPVATERRAHIAARCRGTGSPSARQKAFSDQRGNCSPG